MEGIDLVGKIIGLVTALVTLITAFIKALSLGGESAVAETLTKDFETTIQRSNIGRDEKAHLAQSLAEALSRTRSTSRLNTFLLVLVGTGAIAAAITLLLAPSTDERLFDQLRKQDAMTFHARTNSPMMPSRSFLRGDYDTITDYPSLLSGIQSSLEYLSFTGYYLLHNQEQNLLEALKRPIRIRLLVMDERGENRDRYNQACIAQGYKPENIIEHTRSVRQKARDIQAKIRGSRETYKGDLEIRWFAEPLFYKLILRDPTMESSRIVQVGTYVYSIFSNRPYFRSGKYGAELADKMYQDFEALWKRSSPQ